MATPDYLAGYPAPLVAEVGALIASGELATRLRAKYPQAHEMRSDRALYDYVADLKDHHLRNCPPPSKVAYDSQLQILSRALGMHSSVSRVQGSKLKNKREIRVAAVFRDMPEAFLRMIVVHELAHFRERDHDKAFYQLCRAMDPDYHQHEFELRAYLSHLASGGGALWGAAGASG